MVTMTVALDSWAVVSVAKRQAGAETVREAIESGTAVISWINLGEIYYILARQLDPDRAQAVVDATLLDARAEVPNGRTVMQAARIKANGGLSYADAFCVVTAQRHGVPVLTGDPELLLRDDIDVVDLRGMP
jgi:PIN domain nuclease of toxin-antitoxin system